MYEAKEFAKSKEYFMKAKERTVIPVLYTLKKKNYCFHLQIASKKVLTDEDLDKVKQKNDEAVNTILDLDDLKNSEDGKIVYFTSEFLASIPKKKVLFALVKKSEKDFF